MDRNHTSAAYQAASAFAPQTIEERAVARVMTQIASSLGDLETAARDLLSRIGPMIPGGSPFEREKGAMASGNTPQPVRSAFYETLESRMYQIQQITDRLNEAARSVEL